MLILSHSNYQPLATGTHWMVEVDPGKTVLPGKIVVVGSIGFV